jgi:hypothetical protein
MKVDYSKLRNQSFKNHVTQQTTSGKNQKEWFNMTQEATALLYGTVQYSAFLY